MKKSVKKIENALLKAIICNIIIMHKISVCSNRQKINKNYVFLEHIKKIAVTLYFKCEQGGIHHEY